MLKARLGQDLDGRIRRALPFLFHPRVHPNALSLLGLLVSLGGAWAWALGAFRLGALVVLAGGIFDLADGVVARHQGRTTRFGAFLDSCLDRVVDVALLFALAMHYAAEGRAPVAWLCGAALLASVMVSYTKARAESVLPGFRGGLLERAERVVILAAGALAGFMVLAVAVVAAGATITAGQRFWMAWRGMQALDARTAGAGAVAGAGEGV